MPTLHEIIDQIKTTPVPSASDVVRREYLAKLNRLTGRATLLYASSFTVKEAPSNISSINRQDIQGFMSALKGITGTELDLIVHSPGGSASATEQIVNYLREKFSDIRVIVPQNAMSAATMLACAANRIVMGKHSALGPIDPQVTLCLPGGGVNTAPAQSLLDEFLLAQQTINVPTNNPLLWIKKIEQYPPALLIECQKVIELSQRLIKGWLDKYMFAGDDQGPSKAQEISAWLGKNENFLTHDRSISIQLAREKGLIVEPLESDQSLQEAVLSVFHATVATFMTTTCFKIVESHLGAGWYLSAEVKQAK